MEKRAIVALLLSLLILIGYQFTVSKLYPPQTKSALLSSKQETAEEVKTAPQTTMDNSFEPESITGEDEIPFENGNYKVIFSNYGAVISKITLNTNIKQGLNVPYEIFNAKKHSNGLFLMHSDKIDLNNSKYSYVINENGIEFKCSNNGYAVQKRFTVHYPQYLIELEVIITNLRSGDVVTKYSLVSGVGASSTPSGDRFLEVTANTDNKLTRFKKHSKPSEIEKTGLCSWQMLKTQYFSMILKPLVPCSGYFVNQDLDGSFKTGVKTQDFTIPGNSSATQKFGLYVGPSDPSLAKDANIGVETALTSGFFTSISQLLISTLKFFHGIFRNWGIAIIALTLFINLLLSPLTIKSYKSMQEMQLLQPKIEKLRQELKSNPQKLQKEIMELYKKYKVNPMGGCLPMLLQMPIFIALYQGLMNSIQLRGAKFLWIKDLSVPEGVKLPFTLPFMGNAVNLLPIAMIVAMFFQQKLTNKFAAMAQTDEQRKQQKMMSVMMTVMFGFLFYNFPSGLVLYWLSNTIIMTVFQFMFTRMPKPAHLLD